MPQLHAGDAPKGLSQKSEKPKRLLGQICQALKRLLVFFG